MLIKFLYSLTLAIYLFFPSVSCSQTVIAGETSIAPSSSYRMATFYPGQIFQASLTTTIASIKFYVRNITTPGTVNVQIYSCSADNAWGSLLNTTTNVPVSTGWVTADVSALNIAVTTGNYYGFRLIPQGGLDVGIGVAANPYPNGQSWVTNGGGFFMPGEDFSFEVLGNTILPVNFISFTAQKQSNTVLLKWSTATEQNSKDFILQHSKDGNNWNNIGTVPASGNSSSIINYSYVHSTPVNDINYYRLLQTDIDGKSSLSDIRTVQFTNAGDAVFTVMDNPVRNGQLKIRLNIPATLSLYNTNGKLLWKRQFNKGIQYIDISGYSPGVYLLKYNELTEKVLIR